MRENPFINQRREQEHYYSPVYISQNVDFPSWVSPKNCLFIGLRGSGKTSILNVFNFELAWLNNTSIIYHESISKYAIQKPNYIGVIYKAERQEKSNWENWANMFGVTNATNLYKAYLSYYFIEQFINSIFQIRLKYKELRSDSDINLIKEILQHAFPTKKLRPKIFNYSLLTLKDEISEIHNLIRQSIIAMEPFADIKQYLYIPNSSELIFNVCNVIRNNINGLEDKIFFALIDDVNRFSDWQLKSVNSLIKGSENPLAFKISSVKGLYHTKDTLDKGNPLGDRDILTYQLNTDKDFTKITKTTNLDDILQAIFNLRVRKVFQYLKEDIVMNDLFGRDIDLENLFYDMADNSENIKFKIFIQKYKEQKEEGKYIYITDYWLDENNVSIVPNAEMLKLKVTDPKLYTRKRKSQVYKKRRQTTIFSIIDYYNLGKKFPYSSFNIIKHITCGSVSEFLRICEKLWPQIEEYIESVISAKKPSVISIDKQALAIKSVSDRVFEGIDDKEIRNNSNVSCRMICNRLGKLFMKFIELDSIRKTTECLSLKVNGPLSPEVENIIEEIVLFEAFVKIPDDSSFLLGLHPILSPHFHLPYRSPFYYSQTISNQLFERLLLGDSDEADRVIDRIMIDRIGDKPGDLFKELKDVE